MTWRAIFDGGAYDEWEVAIAGNLPAKIVAWVCNKQCQGHFTDELADPRINLKTAEYYNRGEVDLDERTVIYEVGEGGSQPRVSESRELELVGTGGRDLEPA